MKESFEEFTAKTRKITDNRIHKVTNSLGIRQAFLFVLKNKWFDIGKALKESLFLLIIRTVNMLLAQELMKGNDIRFPKEMGSLELRKYLHYVSNKDGLLKIVYPIDWDATLKLWYEDEESFKNRQLVRVTTKEGAKILYNKANAHYENKTFFQFTPNRDVKRIVLRRFKQGKIDVFEI